MFNGTANPFPRQFFLCQKRPIGWQGGVLRAGSSRRAQPQKQDSNRQHKRLYNLAYTHVSIAAGTKISVYSRHCAALKKRSAHHESSSLDGPSCSVIHSEGDENFGGGNRKERKRGETANNAAGERCFC